MDIVDVLMNMAMAFWEGRGGGGCYCCCVWRCGRHRPCWRAFLHSKQAGHPCGGGVWFIPVDIMFRRVQIGGSVDRQAGLKSIENSWACLSPRLYCSVH